MVSFSTILASGFKASETLLGIETRGHQRSPIIGNAWRFKASETLLGIETKTDVFAALVV